MMVVPEWLQVLLLLSWPVLAIAVGMTIYKAIQRLARRLRRRGGEAGPKDHEPASLRNNPSRAFDRHLLGAFVPVMGLGFTCIGGMMVWEQTRKFMSYRPVQAVVVSKRIDRRERESRDNEGSRRYIVDVPVVEYATR
jgi:hypothetical protein